MAGKRAQDRAGNLKRWRGQLSAIPASKVLGAEDMAAAAGVSWRHMKDEMVKTGRIPVAQKGGRGKGYEFNAHDVLKALIAEGEAELAKVRKLTGQGDDRKAQPADAAVKRKPKSVPAEKSAPDPVPEKKQEWSEPEDSPPTVRELSDLFKLEQAINREMRDRGELVPYPHVENMLMGLVQELQEGLVSTRTRSDPLGQLSPEQAKAVDAHSDNLIIGFRQNVERWLSQNAPSKV